MGAERERVAGFGRLEDGLRQAGEWYRWGPYVSERQWGTVREDYSPDEALRAASVPVIVHPGRGLIHGCFDMLGVTAAARDEMDRVLRSVREALANEDKER